MPTPPPEGENQFVIVASVLDKSGLPDFLAEVRNIIHATTGKTELILSTGGTAGLLTNSPHRLNVKEVADHTGFPEGMDGRLKTLHPKIHGGLLRRPGVVGDAEFLTANGITAIDMLVVNLYNFRGAVNKFNAGDKTVEDFAEVIENIDIGGPAMLRSTAKGPGLPVIRPGDYDAIIAEMKANNGVVTPALEAQLRNAIFNETSQYDKAIDTFLGEHPRLYAEYLQAQRDIADGRREIFNCWKPKPKH